MREIIDLLTRHYTTATAPRSGDLEAELPPSATDKLRGCLRQLRKELPASWVFNRRGLELRAALAATAEHGLDRTELSLVRICAPKIAEQVGEGATLVEFGGGEPCRARALLEALKEPLAYVPVAPYVQPMWSTTMRLQLEFPYIAVRPVVAEESSVTKLPDTAPWAYERVMITAWARAMSHLSPVALTHELRRLAGLAGRGGVVVVGTEMPKPAAEAELAYNDSQGLAAELNFNAILRLNQEFQSDFDPAGFRHSVDWNPSCDRVEISLESRKRQQYRLGGDLIAFERGEKMLTHCAYKYEARLLQRLAMRAGLRTVKVWVDAARTYSLHLFAADDTLLH